VTVDIAVAVEIEVLIGKLRILFLLIVIEPLAVFVPGADFKVNAAF